MFRNIKSLSGFSLFLVIAVSAVFAYTPIGPIGNGGDSWEVPTIGCGLTSDIGAPKNLGEEYRLDVPNLVYASDQTFISYFGLAGLTNIDLAAGLLNQITNVDSYSPSLSEIPQQSQQINYSAQSLGLTDLKSMALGGLVEHIGLASPDRYAWTLHDRYLPPGITCPVGVEYLVVQRNFDVLNTPLNQIQYSPYVNGTLYSYQIVENCTGPNPQAVSYPYLDDPLASTFTPVASFIGWGVYIHGVLRAVPGLNNGGFYTGLSQDDVAGLRHLYSTNNIVYENPASSGGLLIVTNNLTPAVFGPTLPFSLLLNQALTNDPATLQSIYPGLTYLSVTTNIVNQVATNIAYYFTNLPPPYTNSIPLSNNVAVYPANGTVAFTNWSPVQYEDPPQLLETRPLAPLLYLAQYLDPSTLESVFPGLLIGNVQTNYLTVQISTNLSIYYTNQSVLPVFSNTVAGGLPLVTSLTNIYYFTNQPGPTVINYDITQNPTIVPTLDLANFSDLSKTSPPAVMETIYPGLQILRATTSPSYQLITNYVSYLTNSGPGTPYQGPPKLVTVVSSIGYQWITNWNYVFGNVFTNHFYTNRFVTIQSIWITNTIGAAHGAPYVAITNTITYKTNLISGDFFLIPTNWCGFDLRLALPLGVPPYTYGVTNTVIYNGYNSSGSVGTNAAVGGNSYGLTQNFYDRFTNYSYALYPGICEPVLAQATNYSTNIISKYQYNFLNVVTNHYYTNSLVYSFTTNIYYIPGGSPDLLATNISNTTYYTNLPGGDYYLIPTNWCGFQIAGLLTNLIVPTNIVLTNQSYGSGTITSAQYTVVQYLGYTNYTYSIRPGRCEPALASATNFATNILTQYSYYFGNIVTNHYYTNSSVMVVTTNYAVLTNGLVGALTNIISTNYVNGGIDGDFYIVPTADCAFTVISTPLTTVTTVTNTLVVTNVSSGAALLPGQQYVQTFYRKSTNSTLLVQQSTCSTLTPGPALRQGVGHISFTRANYDSLLGQFFQPITNYYTMVKITNSQPVTEYYQRILTAPDIIFAASDQASGPADGPTETIFSRSINFDQSTVQNSLAGPGVINPPTKITFTKTGPIYANTSPYQMQGPSTGFGVQWGSFDATTNTPVVYPNGTSISDLQAEMLLQVTPATLTVASHGVAYSQVFTANGGQPPYTWSSANVSANVPGLTFIGGTTNLLSGIPSSVGTFSFTVTVTDSASRVVNLPYTLIVQ
jgi:hypothetical protein